ncbi:conjugal transfer protein [Paenibacillus sp. LHD-117]|uniref:conjugal transfer protein n=1 Tax=Paenibacillus sp. LHD-117 TaxID=3071412 RepID=UPI0027E107C4|nr:conjugal transfer protein [Paenibacillus sp. LHD-117]MDQ6422658.1 conjugal transfer protein [Paenibacillus sp. LHD-117]
MIRKGVSFFLYILLGLSAIGGIGVIADLGGKSAASAPTSDAAVMQAIAEQFVEIYMTVDNNQEERQTRLASIAPDAALVVSKFMKEEQIVETVVANEPFFSNGRAIVTVETWVSTFREVVDENEKAVRQKVLRNFSVYVYLNKDAEGRYFVNGLPIIHESSLAQSTTRMMDESLIATRDAMMPTLNAVVPALFNGTINEVVNYLIDQPTIRDYTGEFEFQEIQNVWVRETEKNKYVVDVDVKVTDKVLQSEQYFRLNTRMVLDDGKYYVEFVG